MAGRNVGGEEPDEEALRWPWLDPSFPSITAALWRLPIEVPEEEAVRHRNIGRWATPELFRRLEALPGTEVYCQGISGDGEVGTILRAYVFIPEHLPGVPVKTTSAFHHRDPNYPRVAVVGDSDSEEDE